MQIAIPYPPSINHYYKKTSKGFSLTPKAKTYRQNVLYAIRESLGVGIKIAPPYKVHITAYPPDRRKRDLDNVLKASLDAIEASGLIVDDSLISDLHIVRGKVVKFGYLKCEIETHEDTAEDV